MGNWKIVNLQDVNDSAAGRLHGLEVRMARNDLESRDVGVSLFRYGPNVRNPMSHQHRERFRTLFVADAAEAEQVRSRVEAVLGDGAGWRLVSVGERAVRDAERPLADRLLSGPRAS